MVKSDDYNLVGTKIQLLFSFGPFFLEVFYKLSPGIYPGCQRFFFSLGETELSAEAAKASSEAARRKPAPLTLTLLAAGEREDLWHPGYPLFDCSLRDLTNQERHCPALKMGYLPALS